jgi:hypothetical protein
MSERVDIEALRALIEKATPGEWWEASNEVLRTEPRRGAHELIAQAQRGGWSGELNGAANAALIAAAVNALPALLDEVAQLRAENAALRERVHVGDRMSNLCFNLSQESWSFEPRHRQEMRDLCAMWDAARPKEQDR